MRTKTLIDTIGQARLARHSFGAAVLLAALSAGSYATLAQAASFQCPKNASSSERLVCGDPTLSSLDDKLATVYQRAKDATPDRDALEADRVNQWQWRQHNCKDKTCVVNWYNRRIGELEADLNEGQQAQVAALKTSVAEQDLDPSARDAILKLKAADRATLHAQQ
ncbi:lysozyme inhibitor LprI family protein [Paraburkholderia megapolitana]|uniref:lysozyme inhibitor LprI family protein n=1 Tax=Paraburkholderia megapolitana TaxID=420953 RepID=UPI0038BCA7C5